MQSKNVSRHKEHHQPESEKVSSNVISWNSPEQPIAYHTVNY